MKVFANENDNLSCLNGTAYSSVSQPFFSSRHCCFVKSTPTLHILINGDSHNTTPRNSSELRTTGLQVTTTKFDWQNVYRMGISNIKVG